MRQSTEESWPTFTASGLPVRKVPRRKVHCILPSSPWLADSKTNVPLGVLYIAGLLREHGHDVVVTSMLDKRYEGNIRLPDEVMDADVHMLGFCTPQFGEALEIAAHIRDRAPEALIVAGGPHPSYEPKETKEAGRQEAYHRKGPLRHRRDYRAEDGHALFDTVIVMEGEVATLQMLSDWDAGQLQPYYYGDKAAVLDLDAIPFPAWDLLPPDHIHNDGVAVMKRPYFPNAAHPESTSAVMSLIGTRGCPYKCTYCFVEGTPVSMADGSRVPIEMIRAGDRVLAFDRDTGAVEAQEVLVAGARDADDVYEVKLSDGTIMGVTGDHPFVTPQGWQRVSAFKPGTEVRRLRWPNARRAGEAEDVLDGVSHEDRGPAARREVARGSRRAHGASQPDGGPLHAREDGRDGARAVRERASGRSADQAGAPVRAGAGERAAQGAEAGHAWSRSDVGAHEARQPHATTGGGRQAVGHAQGGAQGREGLASAPRRLQRAGARAVRVLRRAWAAARALRWAGVLDRAVRVRQAAQSGHAALVEEARRAVQWPVLALAGVDAGAARGLRERWLERAQPVGGGARAQAYGPCPGARVPGEWVRVESIAFVGRRRVYPLTVATHETFFAHGVATHNCSTPWIGQKPRYRSPHNIIAEMEQVMARGVRMFKFQDDTYTLHRAKLRELADAVDAHFGRDAFAARIHTRVNTMDDHVAESLKRMSCKVTCFGIESGSQRVLDANQKGTTTRQNTEAIIKAKEHGFYTIAFLVIGMAGETVETARETQEWLLSVKPWLDSCNLAVGIPYPGSRWWTHPTESGIDILDYNYDNQWIVGFSARDEVLVRPHGATVDEMFRVKREMFDFLVDNGWAKAEWDEDVRIRRQQVDAVERGVIL